MKILAYKGKSLISKAIQWQTRSPYSHVGVMLDDTTVIEAWHVGGVSHVADYKTLHSQGTEVDVYGIDQRFDANRVERFLKTQVGKKYDYNAILRFITRRDEPADARWFCSELIMAAFAHGELQLLRHVPPSHTTPRDVILCPYLSLEDTWVV